MALKIFKLIFSLAIFLLIQGCDEDRVSIPPLDQDHPPVISINTVARGGGDIQLPEAASDKCPSPCQSYVSLNADLVFVIYAKNPGGVKFLSVTISQNGRVLYTVSRSSTPDSQNRVPPTLSILGTNNYGGIGSYPLLVHMNDPKTKVTVQVTADNFNSQPSSYTVTYYVREQVENEIIYSGMRVIRGTWWEPGCEYAPCQGPHADGDKCQFGHIKGALNLKNISDHAISAVVYTCIVFSRNRWAENNLPGITQGGDPCHYPKTYPNSDWEGITVSSGYGLTWQSQEEKEFSFNYDFPVAFGSCSGWPTYECNGKTTAYLLTYTYDEGGVIRTASEGWGKSADFYKRTVHCDW